MRQANKKKAFLLKAFFCFIDQNVQEIRMFCRIKKVEIIKSVLVLGEVDLQVNCFKVK